MRCLVLTLLASWLGVATTALRSGELHPISIPDRQSASAGGNSVNPSFSPDGKSLLFISHANNLVTNDDFGVWLDVFARNMENGHVSLISVAANDSAGGNGNSVNP